MSSNFYNNQTVVILSTERENFHPFENKFRIKELEERLILLGLPHKKMVGVYKNTSEYSYMVVLPVPYERSLDELARFAWFYEQESILVINPDRTGYLLYEDGRRMQSGRLVSSSERPIHLDSYTHDTVENLFYYFEGVA